MTPLKNMISVNSSATVRQAADQVIRNVYSRYPVFGKSIHHLVGMVMSRDILSALIEKNDQDAVSSIIRPALTVAAKTRSDELLVRFRDQHIHLAIVQENGKTIGVVTLEDVLEELVGEIEDEYDSMSDEENTN